MSNFRFCFEPESEIIVPALKVSGGHMILYLNGHSILQMVGNNVDVYTDNLRFEKVGVLRKTSPGADRAFLISRTWGGS